MLLRETLMFCILNVPLQIDAADDRTKQLEKAMLDPSFASFIYQSLDEVAASTTAPA